MKRFEDPEVEIIRFSAADVITTSNELPIVPGVDDVNAVSNELSITKMG